MPTAEFGRAPRRLACSLAACALGCGSTPTAAVTLHTPRATATITPAPRAVEAAPFAPQPLRGPYADLAAACADAIAEMPAADGLARTSAPGGSFAMATSEHLPPPFRSAGVIVIAERGGVTPLDRCAVVVSTARGYWLASDARVCHGPVGAGHDVQGLAVAATRVGAVMRVETKLTERMETMDPGPRGRVDSAVERTSEDVIVCGAGASARPSCTPPLPLARADWGEPPVRFVLRIEPDEVRLEAPAEAEQLDLDPTWRSAVGRHPLRFP